MYRLLKERGENDEKKIKAQAKLKELEEIEHDDRNTTIFMNKIKIKNKKERIEELEEQEEEEGAKTGKTRKKEQDEKKEEETKKIVRDKEGMKRIAAKFFRKLWRKGHISNRKKEDVKNQVT